MSTPPNPLNKFNTVTAKHVLVAFKYTEDAEQTNITAALGNPGATFTTPTSKGPGIVIANDFTATDFIVSSLKWTWDFYGPLTTTACSCVGYIEITDRTGLYFVDFLKTQVIPVLGVSEGHIVFALRTFFVGTSLNESSDALTGPPLIFNMTSFVNNLMQKTGRVYTMGIVGASTTVAQLNQYSKLYQMTITHGDSSLNNEVPDTVGATNKLSSRKEEDKRFLQLRKSRHDKNKPMRTLQEVFNAFESALNNQKFPHSAQLQSWLQKIRDDYSVKIIPPIQHKIGNIPIDFFVHLDPTYSNYEVDNRNLPFEQPNQDQNKKGIRSIPVKMGTDLVSCVEKLMRLSRKVGQDAEANTPKSFKSTVSMVKSSTDRYQIHVVIKQIEIPLNKVKVNSGPGSKVIEPLEFVFQDANIEDKDIISLVARVSSDVGITILEQQTQDTESLVVYGDREQITAERLPDVDYFKTQYSGLRAMINPYENSGLESGIDAAKVDNSINVSAKQATAYTLVINGNPYLMWDLSRLPTDVANGKVGKARFYTFPETNPMYVKLKIFLQPHASLGITPNDNVSTLFYFDNYLHLYRVTNNFDSGLFTQELELLRTDESI